MKNPWHKTFSGLFALCLVLAPPRTPSANAQAAETGRAPARDFRTDLKVYRSETGAWHPVQTVSDWAIRRQNVQQAMESVMGPFPGPDRRCPLNVQVQEEVDCGTYIRRLITYQPEVGSRVPAYLCIPKTCLTAAGANPEQDLRTRTFGVLCLHPTDDLVGHKVVLGLGGKPGRHYAKELAERGYVTLSPAYPLLADYQPDLKGLGYQSGSMKAIWDNVRGLDLLASLPEVHPGRFGAIGHSLGGHNALFTAFFDARIQVVVTSCGFDSFRDYKNGDITGWTSTRYMPKLADHGADHVPFDFYEVIAGLAPRALWISAPKGDTNFQWTSVRRIVETATPIYALHGAAEHLHADFPDCDHNFPDGMRAKAYSFLDEHLTRDRRLEK